MSLVVKHHAFRLQQRLLQLSFCVLRKRASACGIDDAVPGHLRVVWQRMQHPADGTCGAWVASQCRYLPVGGDFSFRDFQKGLLDFLEELA